MGGPKPADPTSGTQRLVSYLVRTTPSGGLDGGTYNFGMCGDDDGNGNWVNNDQGYVSAVVLNN